MRMYSSLVAAVAALALAASTADAHVVRSDPVLPARGGVYSVMVEGQSMVVKPPVNGCSCQPGNVPMTATEQAHAESDMFMTQQCTMPGVAKPGAASGDTCRCQADGGRWFAPAGPIHPVYVENTQEPRQEMCGGLAQPAEQGVMYLNQKLDLFLDMTNAEDVDVNVSNIPIGALPCMGPAQTECPVQFICVDIENDGCVPRGIGANLCDGYCKFDPNAPPVTTTTVTKQAPKLKDILKECIMENQQVIGDVLKGFVGKGQTVNNGQTAASPWTGADPNLGNMVGQIIGQKLPGAAGNAAGQLVSGCVNHGVKGHNGVGNIVETLVGGKKVLGLDVSDLVGGLLGTMNGHAPATPTVDPATGQPAPAPEPTTGQVVGTVARTLIGSFLENKQQKDPDNSIVNLFAGLFKSKRRRARALLACDPSDPNCGEDHGTGFDNNGWDTHDFDTTSYHDPSDNTYYYTPGHFDQHDVGINDDVVMYDEQCRCPHGHNWASPHTNLCTVAGKDTKNPTMKCRCKAAHDAVNRNRDMTIDEPKPGFKPQRPRGLFSVHLMCSYKKSDLSPQAVRASPVSGEYLAWNKFMERSIFLTMQSQLRDDAAFHCTAGVFYDGNGNGVCLDFQLHNTPKDGGRVDQFYNPNSRQGTKNIDPLTEQQLRRQAELDNQRGNKGSSNTGLIVGLAVGALVLIIIIITVVCLKSSASGRLPNDYNTTFMMGGMHDRSNDYDEFVVNPIRSF